MNLHQAQLTIIDVLRSSLPEGLPHELRPHRGQFESLKEVQQLALRKTAVLVAPRSFGAAGADFGEVATRVQWVAFVLTQDMPNAKRDQLGAVIVSNLLKVLPNNDWGFADSAPDQIAGRNVTSHELDRAGLCLWAISWTQVMAIGDQLALSDLDDFLIAYGEKNLGVDVPPASDEINLPQ